MFWKTESKDRDIGRDGKTYHFLWFGLGYMGSCGGNRSELDGFWLVLEWFLTQHSDWLAENFQQGLGAGLMIT